MPWLATCKKICTWWFFQCFLLLYGFCYWQFSENFISKDSTSRRMVNIFRRFWLMISVSVRMNYKNSFFVMVGAMGMRGFLNIERMMSNFLLNHSAIFLLVWFMCTTSSFVDFPLSYIFLLWYIFLKYSCQFDLHAASAVGIGNASLTIQLV